ncbi:MAG: DUF4209 domain-containing protein [Deferribacterota bacterium]|nr:DUF4209 domain-containing protein [Deferribacterota bacterium]
MLNDDIKKYLDELNQDQKALNPYLCEHEISQEIKNIIKKNKNYKLTKEDMTEQIAFDFMADYQNDDTGWETYYGPMFVLPREKGQMVEYPSIKQVDQKILEYWTKRAKESINPIFSSRYADLVVDFSKKVTNKNAHIDLFHIVIDSNIAICEKSLASPHDCKTKIKRALDLAIKINNQDKIAILKEVIINLEKRVATDDEPGLWGFSFKWLILDFGKKIILNETEKAGLVKDLENRLKRVEKDTWLTENVVSLLAEYYANEKDEKNLMRVLEVLEKSFKADKRINSDALLKSRAYEEIVEIYKKYASCFAEAEMARKRLFQEIGQLDLDWNNSLKEISATTEIKQKDIDDFLKAIFGKNENNKLDIIMARIAIYNLPIKDTVKKQLDDISNEYPIQFLCSTQIISDDGIPIAELSTLEKDYENHFKSYAKQYIQFSSFFLSLTMKELKKRFSKQKIIDYFEKSVVFKNENKEYLKRTISAYWDNDYLAASHFLNPVIESGFRELMRITNSVWLIRDDKDGGFNRLTLTKILWNKKNAEIINNIFSKYGCDTLFYFRLVLIEKLGMNLRNDFAHGFDKKKFFGRDASDRLFHILIWLSLIKDKR